MMHLIYINLFGILLSHEIHCFRTEVRFGRFFVMPYNIFHGIICYWLHNYNISLITDPHFIGSHDAKFGQAAQYDKHEF